MVGLLILLAVVVGAIVAILLGGSDQPRTGAPPPSQTPEADLTYRLRATDDTDPNDEAPQGVHFELATTLSIDLSDVGAGQEATVRVGDVDATFDEQPIPVAIAERQLLRLDEQRRPDTAIIVAADSSGAFVYFIDLLFPVKPPKAEKGDSWPVALELGFPTGTGVARYEGRGRLVGHKEVGGIQAAVVRNRLSFAYDYTMNAADVSALSGLGTASSGTTRVTGTGTMTLTGWVDPVTGRVLRTEVRGDYDVEFRYRDFDPTETNFPDSAIPTSGEFSVSLELVA